MPNTSLSLSLAPSLDPRTLPAIASEKFQSLLLAFIVSLAGKLYRFPRIFLRDKENVWGRAKKTSVWYRRPIKQAIATTACQQLLASPDIKTKCSRITLNFSFTLTIKSSSTEWLAPALLPLPIIITTVTETFGDARPSMLASHCCCWLLTLIFLEDFKGFAFFG